MIVCCYQCQLMREVDNSFHSTGPYGGEIQRLVSTRCAPAMRTQTADSLPCSTQVTSTATEPNSSASWPEFGTVQYEKLPASSGKRQRRGQDHTTQRCPFTPHLLAKHFKATVMRRTNRSHLSRQLLCAARERQQMRAV